MESIKQAALVSEV